MSSTTPPGTSASPSADSIFCVAGLGLFPLVFQNIISDAITPIFDHIHTYVPMLGNL